MQKDACENYLTSADVSRLADGKLTPAAIRQAAASGRLKTAAVTAGGIRLFSPTDARAFLAARRLRKGEVEQ